MVKFTYLPTYNKDLPCGVRFALSRASSARKDAQTAAVRPPLSALMAAPSSDGANEKKIDVVELDGMVRRAPRCTTQRPVGPTLASRPRSEHRWC